MDLRFVWQWFGNYLTLPNYSETSGNSARSIETWIKSSQNTAAIMGWGTAGNRWNFAWNSQGPYIFTDNGAEKRQGTE